MRRPRRFLLATLVSAAVLPAALLAGALAPVSLVPVSLVPVSLVPASILRVPPASLPAAAAATPAAAPQSTVWLCRPGLAHDPCTPPLTTTVTTATGRKVSVAHTQAAADPLFDCFYVYPTVSDQKTPNADLAIDPTERSIALYQAARYSHDCRVFAPMYRQLTLSAIGGQVSASAAAVAYADVLNAWENYLRQYNHGRGVVLIGHSQGAFVLRKLISSQIDPHPRTRRLLVSAVLMGGNVTVKQGSDVGGDFKHIPACHSATQTGCVIAFSTFDAVPPPGSLFGRTTAKGLRVLCTNPAALGGGSGLLDPVYPTAPFAPGSTISAGTALLGIPAPKVSTPWVSAPGAYSARCSSAGGADVLEIAPRSGAPVLHPSPDATWGLHLVDGNIALGNLVAIVHSQGMTYAETH